MSPLKSILSLVTLVVTICVVCDGAYAQKRHRRAAKGKNVHSKTTKVPLGSWGTRGANMNVTAQGAEIDFACAHGSINRSVTVDNNGQFDVTGTYTQEHGGPVRVGEDNSQPARYRGKVMDKTLSLTIELTRSNETLGPFTLTRGQIGRVMKCK